jgi:predicted DNA-binding helix-hairpin-helix protein
MDWKQDDFKLSDEELNKISETMRELRAELDEQAEPLVDMNVTFEFTPLGRRIKLFVNEGMFERRVE